MWLIFGICAIAAAIVNVLVTPFWKGAKWFRFLSLSLTALTLCAFHEQIAGWVAREDWSALMDVVPTTSKALWGLTFGSIAVNSVSLFRRKE